MVIQVHGKHNLFMIISIVKQNKIFTQRTVRNIHI